MHSLLGREILGFPLALGIGSFNSFQTCSWVTTQHWVNRFASHPKYKCSKEPDWVRQRPWRTCLFRELPKISEYSWLMTKSAGNRVKKKPLQIFFRGNGDKPACTTSFSHWIELNWALYLTPVWLDTPRICLQYRSSEDQKLRISPPASTRERWACQVQFGCFSFIPAFIHSLFFLHLHTWKATQ